MIVPIIFVILAILIPYCLGSILFGPILARFFGLGDLRSFGSGNIGASNVLRTGNKVAAGLTVLLDGGKGAISVLIAYAALGTFAAHVAGIAAFLGHLYPIWHKLGGGKGVATFLGVLTALEPAVGVAACATWLAVAFAFRFSSLAAIVASASSPFWALMFGFLHTIPTVTVMTGLLIFSHRENIRRLIRRTEPRIRLSKER